MAGITQTIPQFTGGISEQPDHLKFPGQVKDVTNAIPDITRGLFKRPGAKRVGTDKLPNVQPGGSWFHYYRDETEGSYIGQVAADGQVRVWKASGSNAGAEQTIVYGTGGQTAIQDYLATSDPENLQFLTINDTTFVNSRDSSNANTIIGTTGTTQARPHTHFGFLELLRTENGRQYAINLHGSNTEVTSINRATRIKIESDTLDESDGTGHCPGIGTQVFSVDSGDKKNLIFRINTLGQQGVSPDFSGGSGPGGDDYRCSYNREVVLLHGGEGWVTGDTVTVTLTSASGGGPMGNKWNTDASYNQNDLVINKGNTYKAKTTLTDANEEPTHSSTADDTNEWEFISDTDSPAATYTIRVEDHETTQVNATISSNGDGVIRPEPTPFDADTAVTADTIIGGIIDALPKDADNNPIIDAQHIGNGIYFSSSLPFQLEVVEDDLMRSFQSSVNDVQNLPNQCKHGYIVKVSNALRADEDDYYLRFEGQNGKDGSGSWAECALPGIAKTLTNMPLVIQRTGFDTNAQIATFTVKQFTYADRSVGDNTTNPLPSFHGKRINKVLFFRNRLALLSGENVITSRPGTLDESFGGPDFFIETALTVSASDPIDIAASSMFPSDLFDGIEINTGLVVFSTNQQFLLSSDDTVLNPDTAKLRSISTFNYNKNIAPISLGTTIGYIDNSGKFSRFNEVANIRREAEPNVVEVSKVVPTLLTKNIDLLTNSRENSMIFFGKTGSKIVLGYKYLNIAERRQQAAWFKWKFNTSLLYHFVINDEYFFLDTDHFLHTVKLVQEESDPIITKNNAEFLLHLDNYTTVSGGEYDSTDDITTFSNVGWLANVTAPIYALAVIDNTGRYGKPNVSGTSFTLAGNWSGLTLTVGYVYDYEVALPRLYPVKIAGANPTADVNASLVLHRIKLHFGKIGLYETTLKRIGKPDYNEVYESINLDGYILSEIPYLEEFIKTIPIYERNTNVDIILKSTHPAPATLRALSWEGDYSPRFYKRV